MGRLYRVGAFAEITGVSIRTLHHYDQIGLLQPSARSESGYRLYSEGELLRLQQILTLRYLGYSLASIGALLKRTDFQVLASLRIQRSVLRDRISELERIDAALAEMIDQRVETGQWDWDLVAQASAAVQGSLQRGVTMDSYYTPEQMRQFEELRQQVPAEEIRAVEEGWTALIKDVRASYDLDPASPEAQRLAERWDELTQAVVSGFRGNQELLGAVRENYQRDAFRNVEGAPRAEDFAFIGRIKAARG
jgi:MerR family transcriptional regulator, thiopeptide resistance regulator